MPCPPFCRVAFLFYCPLVSLPLGGLWPPRLPAAGFQWCFRVPMLTRRLRTGLYYVARSGLFAPYHLLSQSAPDYPVISTLLLCDQHLITMQTGADCGGIFLPLCIGLLYSALRTVVTYLEIKFGFSGKML